MATATLPTAKQDQTIVEFDVRTDEMLVNMGPQHPSTHGVLRLVLRTDGEVISEVVPHLGYLHRCAEKIGENVLPIQYIPYTDRMDYLAGMNMNLGYALAVEKLCGMKIPEKANVIRVLVCELNRIASHLVAIGTCVSSNRIAATRATTSKRCCRRSRWRRRKQSSAIAGIATWSACWK